MLELKIINLELKIINKRHCLCSTTDNGEMTIILQFANMKVWEGWLVDMDIVSEDYWKKKGEKNKNCDSRAPEPKFDHTNDVITNTNKDVEIDIPKEETPKLPEAPKEETPKPQFFKNKFIKVENITIEVWQDIMDKFKNLGVDVDKVNFIEGIKGHPLGANGLPLGANGLPLCVNGLNQLAWLTTQGENNYVEVKIEDFLKNVYNNEKKNE